MMVRAALIATVLCASAACAGNSAATDHPGATTQARAAVVRVAPHWVFKDGAFLWGTDYSFNARAYFADRSGAAPNGAKDIRVEVVGPWGGFQPVARGQNFDPSPYAYFTLALKPTIADEAIAIYFQTIGDVPVGVSVSPFKYGPAPVVGQWATYRIPLADLGVVGIRIYKFAIQDKTGLSGHSFYLNDIGFLPP